MTLLAILPLLSAPSASADPCRPDLPPANASYGYRYRAPPDRCEGLYSQPVAGEELELLSFIAGSVPANADRDRTLTISAPDLRDLGATEVTVTGRALPLRVYYRMDTTIPSAGSFTWPVNEVVTAAGLDPAWIGLIGSVRTGAGTVFVPLRIGDGRDAPSSDATPVMVFRTAVDLDSLHWRMYQTGDAAPPWNRIGHPVHAGDQIPLTLDAPPGKVTTVDVAAMPTGADYIQSRFKIYRP